jgi:hypothetical protein
MDMHSDLRGSILEGATAEQVGKLTKFWCDALSAAQFTADEVREASAICRSTRDFFPSLNQFAAATRGESWCDQVVAVEVWRTVKWGGVEFDQCEIKHERIRDLLGNIASKLDTKELTCGRVPSTSPVLETQNP